MGRKPNQLVLEFFDRGAKLDDGSNRYEHTCKACRVHFPKGRIESLLSHLKTKCQSISIEDRHRAILQLDEGLSSELLRPNGSLDPTAITKTQRYTEKLPINRGQKLTGLEALAEASRQIEYPRKPGDNRTQKSNTIDPNLQNMGKFGTSITHPQENSNRVGIFFTYHVF